MAKDIRECLLEQARKFHQWQEITYPGKTTEEIGGAWEVDYPAWNDIFDASAAGPQPPMRMRPSGSLPPICRNDHVVRKSGI